MTGYVNRRLLLLLAVLVALGLAACGGGSSSDEDAGAATTEAGATDGGSADAVSAEQWVGSVCGAITTWQTSITSDLPTFSDPSDVESVIQSLSDYLGGVITATNTMIADVKDAGVPDVDQGEAIANDFAAALQPVADSFAQAQADVDALSGGDPAAAVTELQSIGTEIQNAATQAGAAFDELASKYPDAGFDEAAANAPECASIAGAATTG